MTKRLIDIDDRLLESARAQLGTTTNKETVNRALERAAAEGSRRRADTARALQTFARATADLSDKEIMADAWR